MDLHLHRVHFLVSKHVHRQLARFNPLFNFLNVLVPTGFVLVGQKNNNRPNEQTSHNAGNLSQKRARRPDQKTVESKNVSQPKQIARQHSCQKILARKVAWSTLQTFSF